MSLREAKPGSCLPGPKPNNMKRYMTGVFHDLHFVAELKDGQYYCIPKYSGGNGTQMTFFRDKPGAKFYSDLDEALGNKSQHERRMDGIEEERQLTGYHNPEY